jgi:hypothetical protein
VEREFSKSDAWVSGREDALTRWGAGESRGLRRID